MSSITGENLDRVEVAVLRLTDELRTLFMPMVEVIPKPAEGFGKIVITTRRGVHVVVDDEKIYVRGKKNFSAMWEEVPQFIACLRGALVPEHKKERVEPDLEATSLEMASSWGPSETEEAEIIFTYSGVASKDIAGTVFVEDRWDT